MFPRRGSASGTIPARPATVPGARSKVSWSSSRLMPAKRGSWVDGWEGVGVGGHCWTRLAATTLPGPTGQDFHVPCLTLQLPSHQPPPTPPFLTPFKRDHVEKQEASTSTTIIIDRRRMKPDPDDAGPPRLPPASWGKKMVEGGLARFLGETDASTDEIRRLLQYYFLQRPA